MTDPEPTEQLELLGEATGTRGRGRADRAPDRRAPDRRAPDRRAPDRRAPDRETPALAGTQPVARVALDVPHAHLDRPFDYAVPESMDAGARPGVRVRVRFAGRLVTGFLLGRSEGTEHADDPTRLARLERVVSPEPVLDPDVLRLARAVADRYAGTLADVLRLAVPPRHARVEGAARADAPSSAGPPDRPDGPGPWSAYRFGPELVAAIGRDGSRPPPRAVWSALPGPQWCAAVAVAVRAALAAGRGALVVAPDSRDVDRLDAALGRELGADRHVALTADLGPAERYRRWLALRRGEVTAAVGTRAAMFAPVRDLGLVVVWDDGDDLHAEPHAPYPHVREVLVLRAEQSGAAAVVGGYAVSAEGAELVRSGAARLLVADRSAVRLAAPRTRVAGDDAELARDPAARGARLPSAAWEVARRALRSGPVLVQVPRRGYVPSVACQDCREPARCAACRGPLGLTSGHAVAQCRWCATVAGRWRCGRCDGSRLRAQVVGARRTAEELGRAFPGVPVVTSGRDEVLAGVPDRPALVVATPGAEPVAENGYAAGLLLDGWLLLARPDLRAGEEALRRWLAAAALVRTEGDGGQVVLLAPPGAPPVQALVRWDPVGHAERELAERAAVGLPPAARFASLVGAPDAVADLLARAELPPGSTVLGPVTLPGRSGVGRGAPGDRPSERALVRVPAAQGDALAAALHAGQAARAARKSPSHVRVQIDPLELE